MTNFIYNMQDELFDLNMVLPVGRFSVITKLVDHIEAQGKQLRELNAAIAKRNATIEKYEHEKESLRNASNCLFKKVQELNEGIRDSEDLTWKQKYDALVKKNKKFEERRDGLKKMYVDIMVEKNAIIKGLEEKSKKLEHDYNELVKQRNGLYYENKKLERSNLDLGDTIGLYAEEFKKLKEDLEKEKQVSKDLNVIINSKNKLLDEYMTKCNNLEHNYNEEVRMKEQFKMTCFKHERTIKKLKRDNDILREKANEISDLAESIVMLCDDEE